MGRYSCSEGCGFKSQHHILYGHFSHIFVMFVWKHKNKWKRGRVGQFYWKKFIRSTASHPTRKQSVCNKLIIYAFYPRCLFVLVGGRCRNLKWIKNKFALKPFEQKQFGHYLLISLIPAANLFFRFTSPNGCSIWLILIIVSRSNPLPLQRVIIIERSAYSSLKLALSSRSKYRTKQAFYSNDPSSNPA